MPDGNRWVGVVCGLALTALVLLVLWYSLAGGTL
jgi:hypothetical protein